LLKEHSTDGDLRSRLEQAIDGEEKRGTRIIGMIKALLKDTHLAPHVLVIPLDHF
jgi:hypothetical protein